MLVSEPAASQAHDELVRPEVDDGLLGRLVISTSSRSEEVGRRLLALGADAAARGLGSGGGGGGRVIETQVLTHQKRSRATLKVPTRLLARVALSFALPVDMARTRLLNKMGAEYALMLAAIGNVDVTVRLQLVIGEEVIRLEPKRRTFT